MKKVLILAPFREHLKKQMIEEKKEEYLFLEAAGESDRLDKIKEANIIIGEPDIAEIKEAKNLEWVQMTWAGTDKYTCNPGFPREIHLTNASGAFGDTMAEYAIGEILAMMRHFSYYEKKQKESIWKPVSENDGTLYGKHVLIFGAGDIGSKTAKRLKAFGANVSGVCRNTKKERADFDKLITLAEAKDCVETADVVIGCIPNSEDTRGFLTKERLLSMKKDAILLNMGRGNFIDTEALLEVLQMGWLKGVILDVTNPEPLPGEHPLWKEERVRITPHIAGPSFGKNVHTEELICSIVIDNLSRYAKGEALRNLIW